jgi:diguanylate cyclase (GGDEF)-like protein/PAS domain S-box-containing protein
LHSGLDVTCTKIAVDFQNLSRETAEHVLRENLDLLRDASSCDAALAITLDPTGLIMDTVMVSRGTFAQCHPEALRGDSIEAWAWLRTRLDHLRLSAFIDTTAPRRDQQVEAARLAGLHIGSMLLVAYRIGGVPAGFLGLANSLPRASWDVNLQLLLKLLGTSLATGLGRLTLEARLAKLEERVELSKDAANDGLWDFDVERNEMYFSPRWRAMLGYSDTDLDLAPDWRALVHPEDMSRVQSQIREHVAGKSPIFESIHRMRHRNGEWRWVQSRAKARLDANGRLLRLVGVELDITERKLYEDALFREKESAQITLQSIGDGVITTDANSVIDYINPVAEQLTGWRLEDSMGRPVDEIFRTFHEETCEPLENPLTQSVRRVRPIKSVRPMLLIRKDGNELYVESTAAPIRDGAGKVSGGVLVFHDVSESRELNRRLSYQSSHDLLTGLVNRREFESRLERALKSAKARESSYALCYLDLDQFKIINDSCGHSAGDALLGQVGALLKAKVRWRDTLSRLGGDEFGILLEACALDDALRMAEALREAVRNFRFTWEDRVFRLGASIGVVPITADNEDVASIISAADSACQAAKEAGRNRVHSFAENDIELMRRRREMQWAARINAALEEGRFELYRHDHPAAAEGRGRRALRAAAAHARRERQGGGARQLHGRRRALRHHAVDRSLGDRERTALAGLRGRRTREPVVVRDQSLGPEPRRRQVPAVRDRAVPAHRHRRHQDLLRDHRDGGGRELLAGQPLHPGPEGTGLQVLAGRLRHRPVVLRLPEALPGRLPEDRRQLRARDPARPHRSRDGALDQRDRAPDRQADDRGVRREPRDHPDAAQPRRRLCAGLWHCPAAARAQGHKLLIN